MMQGHEYHDEIEVKKSFAFECKIDLGYHQVALDGVELLFGKALSVGSPLYVSSIPSERSMPTNLEKWDARAWNRSIRLQSRVMVKLFTRDGTPFQHA